MYSMSDTSSIDAFWQCVRVRHPELPKKPAEAWSFGATPEIADELLLCVLTGAKSATASSLWDYQAEGEELPHVGKLNIILDGAGVPCAVIETTAVDIVPFNEVSAEHAYAEGEGDRSLAYWREAHEYFWRTYGALPSASKQASQEEVEEDSTCGFAEDMPVVCERFRLVYPG